MPIEVPPKRAASFVVETGVAVESVASATRETRPGRPKLENFSTVSQPISPAITNTVVTPATASRKIALISNLPWAGTNT